VPAKPRAVRLQHSLWDRLIHADRPQGEGVGTSTAGEIARLRDEVRRDLEWLLNSRRSPVDLSRGLSALERSVMTYGLPDFSGLCLSDPNECDRLTATLATTIGHFEPRLTNVRVHFDPTTRDGARPALHYRIEALLRVDPVPEPVTFDTVLELADRSFTVKNEGT
jgi:type VI secretion system protein ImpF